MSVQGFLSDLTTVAMHWVRELPGSVVNALVEIVAAWQILPWKGQSVVLAGACIGVLLLILLNSTPGRSPARRRLWLAVISLCVAFVWLSGALLLQLVPGAQGALLVGILVSFGVWSIGKTLQANRFAALRDARYGDESRQALSSQREAFLKSLGGTVIGERHYAVIGLQGGWGGGKSRLAECLVQDINQGGYLGQKDEAIAVSVNVWEYQNYGDLQWGVLQALYAHPETLRAHGWLDLPLWMLLSHWLRLRLRDFRLASGWGEVHGQAELRLPWQYHFEKVIARHRRRGRNVLIIIDEIDRCGPGVAQAALTLLRRSLNIPGVIAMVPYVPDSIRHKAFSPLALTLPDLVSTAYAILLGFHHEIQQQAINRPSLPQTDKTTTRPEADGRAAQILNPYLDARLVTQPGRDETDAADTMYRAVQELAPLLDRQDFRQRYYRLMEEKYLGERWHVPQIDTDDLRLMLEQDETIRQAFAVAYPHSWNQELKKLDAWLGRQIKGNAFMAELGRARFRRLRGYWQEHLTRTTAKAKMPEPQILLALAVWRAARGD
jgi:hypothetical protein